MYERNHRTAIVATMNDVTHPMAIIAASCPLIEDPVFRRSSAVAASMVGMARMKENSTIVVRLSPTSNPPMIVAAERDTPGMMAMDWKSPMMTACRTVIVSIVSVAEEFSRW